MENTMRTDNFPAGSADSVQPAIKKKPRYLKHCIHMQRVRIAECVLCASSRNACSVR